MKYLKSINEYRTAGFKYSDPDINFTISLFYEGDVTVEKLEKIFNRIKLKYDSIEIDKNGGTLELPDDDDNVTEVEVDGSISFNIDIYTEIELDTIIDEISSLLLLVYNINSYDYKIKQSEKNLD